MTNHNLRCPLPAITTLLATLLVAAACTAQEPVLPGPPPPPPAAACLTPTGPLAPAEVTLTLAVGTRHQVIAGFGTSVRLFDDPHLTETFDAPSGRGAVLVPPGEQTRILAALHTDLGLTRLRYATDPGIELVNDNADPAVTNLAGFDFRWKRLDGHVELVQAARPRGVTTWFGSPIVLESWMSRDDPAEYVEWAMAVIRRWRDQGATLPYWSIVNEPGYRGGLSGAFIRDAVKLLGAKLAAEGIATRLVIPDDIDPSATLGRAQVILADPVARGYVAAIAFHLYDATFPPAAPNTAALAELAALARQHGLPLWMTEWYSPDWFTWATTMHLLLADYDVAAIDYMWGFLGQWEKVGSQLITVTHDGPFYTGFVKSQQYWTMGHWSRFVPPGSRRVGLSSSSPAVQATAFLVGDRVVIVALNTGSVGTSVQLALGQGAPCIRRMTAERTSAAEAARLLEPALLTGPGFTTTLPAKSLTTFVLAP